MADAIQVAHISDLHFGARNADPSWAELSSHLKQLKPHLMLVTGDIADSPSEKTYKAAKAKLDAIGIPYFVCRGNHDNFPKGNLVGWVPVWLRKSYTATKFNDVFEEQLARRSSFKTFEIHDPYHLRIGILGLDSSRDADFSARGHVDAESIGQLRKTMQEHGSEYDLVVLLLHHHLLPVRKLEESHLNDLKDLANVTSLVNASSLLEELAESHVDIVAHGHEHASYWGRYGSLECGGGEVAVLGAASATGNDSIEGCDCSRSAFNLITIFPDGTAKFCEISRDKGWHRGPETALCNATAFRRMRLFRQLRGVPKDIVSRVVKVVEFTDNEDIRVRWVMTRWELPAHKFQQQIENSTGMPTSGLLKIIDSTDQIFEKTNVTFNPAPSKQGAWTVDIPVDPHIGLSDLRIEFEYVWQNGAVLTHSKMNQIMAQAPGPIRAQGKEFGSVLVHKPVESAQLILIIPPSTIAPDEMPELSIHDATNMFFPDETKALSRGVLRLGPGRFTITVPYPRQDWWYALAWAPVSSAAQLGAAAAAGSTPPSRVSAPAAMASTLPSRHP